MADSELSTLGIGDTIDDYRIKKVLGAGSFGVTYLAEDMHLNREVAIKEYMPEVYARRDSTGTVGSRNEESSANFDWGLDRFSEEARTLAQFNHPNIVSVLRIVQAVNGTSYMIMELLGGVDLERVVEAEGPLKTERFLSIFRQLLDGMQAVHRLGILHRDIKPANIMLEDRGPVIIDFGAARDLAIQKKAGFSALVSDGFSPPEQYSRKNIQTEASDIYALAASAHYLLSGEVPPPSAARFASEELAPASSIRPDLPADVAAALDHALVLPIEERPQSIGDWLAEMPSLTAEPPPEKEVVIVERGGLSFDRRGLLLLGGGVAAAVTAGYLLFNRDTSISSSSAPLAFAWTKPAARLSGEAYPGIAATQDAVFLAAHELGEDGNDRLLLARFDGEGAATGRYLYDEPGSRAHSVLPLDNGDLVVAGETPSGSLVIRLGPDLQPLWVRSFPPASISTLLRIGPHIVAGLEGPQSSGQAKLLFITPEGQLQNDITLLDRQGDSVQQIAGLADGSIAVLGARLEERFIEGASRNVAGLWLARVATTGEELWRVAESGLGYALGQDVIEAGGELFVSGKTSPDDDPGNYRAMMMRVSGDGQKVWTRHDYDGGPSSGRGMLRSGDSQPRLYMAGWTGSPTEARLAQLAPDGELLWSETSDRTRNMGDVYANMASGPDGAVFVVGMDIEADDRLALTLSRFA